MTDLVSNPSGMTRRRLLRGICSFSLAAGGGFLLTGLSAAATPGGTFVVKAGADLIRAAKSGSASAFRSLLKSYIDVSSIAMFALGKYRSKMPENLRSEYVGLVEGFMVYTLAQFGKKFKGREFEVLNARQTSRGVTVQTVLKFLGGKKQKVTWKLAGSGGNYRVSDINFQGVWLAGLMRSTFSDLIRKNGNSVDGLMNYLRGSTPGNAKVKSDCC